MSLEAAALLLALVAGAPVPGGDVARQTRVLGLALETATFDDAARVLGPTERRFNGGDAHAGSTGACYVGADGTVLSLVSHSEMGENTRLTRFELLARRELADFSGDPRYTVPGRLEPRCAASSRISRALRTDGGVHLGMTRKQVQDVVGAPSTSRARSLSFASETPVPGQPDCTTGRGLTVEFEHGRAVAIRVEQITSC